MNSIFFQDLNKNFVPEILKEIYVDRIYDPFLTGRYNLVIVDAGANIGLTSFYFKDFARIVYAIEPAKMHRECLENMVVQNGIENIKLLPNALSDKQEKTKLYHSPNITAHSLLTNTTKNQEDFEEVDTITLDFILGQTNIDHIDFLKLDVEGMESQIVTSKRFAEISPKINTIIGEWHSWGFTSKPFFKSTLERLGYHFSWIPNMEADIFTCVR